MQKRLENITSTPYLKFNLPIQLAHTFYLYDCWVSKESQPSFRGIGLSYCRENFSKMLNELEIYFNDSKKKSSLISIFFYQNSPDLAYSLIKKALF